MFVAFKKDDGDEKDKQITFKLPLEMYDDLIILASKKGDLPMGQVIRFAVEDYISKAKLKGWL
ncbi:hypothetical protein [Methanobacterium alcaliphilum]|uniref:hypothetical protein n=1 Tax=Methanobacterium alcaliphilum TaxID=392018 RepID=UPI00200B19AF|nr:hypothetical protein [Methanobacterium alcaliphilum]MCK9151881.1 hypothetical protein [Methanobacterium alcaliphilum]